METGRTPDGGYAVRIGGVWETVDEATYETAKQGRGERLAREVGSNVTDLIGLGIEGAGLHLAGPFGDISGLKNFGRNIRQSNDANQQARRNLDPAAVGTAMAIDLAVPITPPGVSAARSAGAIGRGAARGTRIADDVITAARQAPAGMAANPWKGRGLVAEQVGAALDSNPITTLATGGGRRAAQNADALEAVAKDAIGVPGMRGDMNDALRASQARHETFFRQELPEAMQGVELARDQKLIGGLEEARQMNMQSLNKSDRVETVLGRLLGDADDTGLPTLGQQKLTGANISTARSELGQARFDAVRAGDSGAVETFDKVIEQIDEALERSLETIGKDSEILSKWRQVRREYAHRMALQETNVVNAEGVINARSLRTKLLNKFAPKTKNRPQGNALYDAADFVTAQQSGIPDSGTSTRSLVNLGLQAGATALGVGALGGF